MAIIDRQQNAQGKGGISSLDKELGCFSCKGDRVNIYRPTRSLPPSTRYVHAIRRRKRYWENIIAELIDNSGDAGADDIQIRFGGPKTPNTGGWFEIDDNGRGIRDIDSLLRLGVHDSVNGGESVGMFGVGGTEAIVWIGDRAEIRTVLETDPDMVITQPVDWISLERDGTWNFEQALHTDVCDEEPGTIIRCDNVQHRRPDGTELAIKLSEFFRFGLQDGWRIRLEIDGIDYPVATIIEPAFSPAPIVAKVPLGSGRWLDVRGGMAKEGIGTNPSPGITYGYLHRTIEANSAHGLTNKLGYNRISATVRLGGDWSGLLETNKSGLGKCEEEIIEAIEPVFAELSEQAAEQGVEIRFKAIQSVLKEKCDELNDRIRETRNPGTTKGTNSSTGTGRPRKPKKGVPVPGGAKGMQISICSLGDKGRFISVKSGGLIQINQDHPSAVSYLNAESVAPLYAHCVDIYTIADAIGDKNGPLFASVEHSTIDKFLEYHDQMMRKVDVSDLISKAKVALRAAQ
jgi:hypothetical protein